MAKTPNPGATRVNNNMGEIWNGREWVPDYGQGQGQGGLRNLEEIWGFDPASGDWHGIAGQPGSYSTRDIEGYQYRYDPTTASWRKVHAAAPAAAPTTPTTPVTSPITGTTEALTPDQQLARSNTNRSLELLRSTLGQSENQGIADLRQNLAQRGLMDSGSLGRGITDIANYGAGQMARGTLAAANQENDTLLGLIQQARAYQQAKEMQARQLAYEQWAMQQQLEQARMMANSQMWAGALEGGLGGLGSLAGGWLGRPSGGGGQLYGPGY